jgi:hypothetical protein
MPTYKTPAVYVAEKSIMPPSVAEVPTAIPAFIGYTAKTTDAKGDSIINIPTRVTSMVEFVAAFGGCYLETSTVVDYKADSGEFVVNAAQPKLAKFFLYHAVSHFFSNGGGKCYVVSIGAGYNTVAKSKNHFMSAIDCLKKVDEVTLIVTPESVGLSSDGHYDVHNKSLSHSTTMGDRFSLIDCIDTGDIVGDAELLRNKVVGTLKYGAAYYPNLQTSIARTYDEDLTQINYQCSMLKIHDSYKTFSTADGRLTNEYGYLLNESLEVEEGDTTVYPVFLKISDDILVDAKGFKVDVEGKRVGGASYGIFTDVSGTQFLNILGRETDANSNEEKTSQRYEIAREDKTCSSSLAYLNDANGRLASTAIYNQVKAVLNKNYLILPPCGAVAGVIAKVDGTRGVWQAPANVALTMTVAPNTDIDHFEQEDLNVDVVAGKSINAIRSFVGKGTLIWGARTLAGNDNEWRYVPVRRLFNMIEESIQKGTAFAVFEPNTPFTWLKVSTMIRSYLEGLWKQGALFGASPDEAFFVNIGLGQTMTEDDILNGRMNVEIGIAAVRPAEFIILTFSHKSIGA